MDLKTKLNIVSGIIANAKKGLESLKTEINDVKSDHAMFKKDLNSLNNEFSECLKDSLKVTDNLIKIDNDILMTKNESYIDIKNRHHVVKNDMLIFTANCINLKSMIRENVKLLKNIKNNLYGVKKNSDIIQIDLKQLKEEFVNNVNKRAKIRSIFLAKIKTYSFKRIIRIIKAELMGIVSSKNNVASTIKDSGIVDACTSADDAIVKKYVDVCTSTDDLIVKNHVIACTSTDDVCTNKNELSTNENEPFTNENEPCTNENDDSDDDDGSDDDDSDDKPDNNDNKPGNNGNKPGDKDNNDNKPGKNDNKDNKQGNKDNDNKLVNNDNKKSRQMNFAISLRKCFLNNITKITKLVDELNDEIYDDDQWLVFAQLNKINPLVDELIDRV